MSCRNWSPARALPAVVISTCLLTSAAPVKPLPLHEKETKAAWEAYQAGQLGEAIEHADICIREFRGVAKRKHAALLGIGAKVPVGVVDDRGKKIVFENGPLNDVVTCYYIKGRAAYKLGQVDVAAMAHADAMKYPLARAWDQRGWFWSPAEAAQRFLKNPAAPDKAPHENYTDDAWAAFNGGDHALAMVLADRCDEQFRQAALEMQKAISSRGKPTPDGQVPDDVKKRIHENGVLNDVATCLFIKGQAAEAKGDKKTALRAYEAAKILSHGRAWDPQGWFWSPAEASARQIEIIRR